MNQQTGSGSGQQVSTSPKLEYWRELRSLIVHEDNLVNHRFSWLLTYEGFLMGGFFLIQGGLLSAKIPASALICAEVFLCVVLMLSMWICYITGQTICAAYKHTANVFQAWVDRFPEEWREACTVPDWLRRWKEESGSFRQPTFGQTNVSKIGVHQPGVLQTNAPQSNAAQLNAQSKSEFPSILGHFKYPAFGRTARIPFILGLINLLAAAACLLAIAYVLHRPESFAQQPPVAPVENKTVTYVYKEPNASSTQPPAAKSAHKAQSSSR